MFCHQWLVKIQKIKANLFFQSYNELKYKSFKNYPIELLIQTVSLKNETLNIMEKTILAACLTEKLISNVHFNWNSSQKNPPQKRNSCHSSHSSKRLYVWWMRNVCLLHSNDWWIHRFNQVNNWLSWVIEYNRH